ncbi:hypothetical protein HD806DRAFT_120465 [Xylariaceae sp. AK1471]|nr:hypothetical protein HD806DRAFT_120465 [Xylariaceae sp. AK1471]
MLLSHYTTREPSVPPWTHTSTVMPQWHEMTTPSQQGGYTEPLQSNTDVPFGLDLAVSFQDWSSSVDGSHGTVDTDPFLIPTLESQHLNVSGLYDQTPETGGAVILAYAQDGPLESAGYETEPTELALSPPEAESDITPPLSGVSTPLRRAEVFKPNRELKNPTPADHLRSDLRTPQSVGLTNETSSK